jgi:hypothetical protein
MHGRWLLFLMFCAGAGLAGVVIPLHAHEKSTLDLTLRSRGKGEDGPFTVRTKQVHWEPKKTALIICDMWDRHWCRSAEKRVGEMAGPLNEVVKKLRSQGVFIIHAPSTCTEFYKGTPQRKLAQSAPFAKTPVPLATVQRWGTAWCYPDPKREPALPIDDSDMGCDCAEHCKIDAPWTRQIATIDIAPATPSPTMARKPGTCWPSAALSMSFSAASISTCACWAGPLPFASW